MTVHGSNRAYYREGCRCDICKLATFRRRKKWAMRSAVDPMIDADEVRARIGEWEAEGFKAATVLRVAYRAISRSPNQSVGQRIRRSRAKLIMSVTRADLYEHAPHGALVPNIGTVRRIHALRAIGWPLTTMEPKIAQLAANAVTTSTGLTLADTHRRVAELYRQLSMKPGPSASARARSSGVSPLAWDDDAIDDPDGRPDFGAKSDGTDENVVHRLMSGEPIKASISERREAVRRLTMAGRSSVWIAEQIGVSYRTVERYRAAS